MHSQGVIVLVSLLLCKSKEVCERINLSIVDSVSEQTITQTE